jgi:hypothetical protein
MISIQSSLPVLLLLKPPVIEPQQLHQLSPITTLNSKITATEKIMNAGFLAFKKLLSSLLYSVFLPYQASCTFETPITHQFFFVLWSKWFHYIVIYACFRAVITSAFPPSVVTVIGNLKLI